MLVLPMGGNYDVRLEMASCDMIFLPSAFYITDLP
jgi:hypothetical protein